MIQVKNLAFSFTDVPLYEGVNFIIGEDQKIGLVGPNGSGKTTLLNIIAGKENPSEGKVEVIGKISYVPQEIKRDPEMEGAKFVMDYVNPDNIYEPHEIKKIFAGLELTVSLAADPKSLSGGQKTKLALAKALLESPDILVLDEPTNFMDEAGKKWVMSFLARYPKTVIVISHDLALMNHAIDKILYVNPMTKTIDEYKGNYNEFERLKKEKEELQKRQAQTAQKKVANLEQAISQGLGVRARINLQNRIARMKVDLPSVPEEIRKIKIRLPDPANVGEIPLKADSISKSYGDKKVLKNVSLTVMRGERIALIGPNGVGKSTFIKILMGMLEPDSGTVIKNPELKVGYYSQEFETFDMRKTLIDTFVEVTHLNEGMCRAYLGRYMLGGNKITQSIETLSGGEKTRLAIALLTANNYNLLILDEPTTYLDVLSQRIILEALKEYKGAMLIVSHTPEFVIELKPNRAYIFPEEKTMYWENSIVEKIDEV